MQDDDGRPAEGPTGPDGAAPSEADGDARRERRRRLLVWIAAGLAVALVLTGGIGTWVYERLNGNIHTEDFTDSLDDRNRPPPTEALNLLLVGSDSRDGDNSVYGPDTGGSRRSDTTILLHVPEGRRSAIGVSFPRDLMVGIPECRTDADGTSPAHFGQFNSAMAIGGVPCTVATVEGITGVRVDHQITIDFVGFTKVVDALGGVPMHIAEPIDDEAARLHLPAGDLTLDGEQALGFVRTRKSIGDGSDIQRIARQHEFLRALIAKVQSEQLLMNPPKLYGVLDATTKAITTDPGLGSLKALYTLVRGLRGIPGDQVRFETTPLTGYAPDPNRVVLKEPEAGELFARLRDEAAPRPEPAPPPSPAPTASSAPAAPGPAGAGGPPVPLPALESATPPPFEPWLPSARPVPLVPDGTGRPALPALPEPWATSHASPGVPGSSRAAGAAPTSG